MKVEQVCIERGVTLAHGGQRVNLNMRGLIIDNTTYVAVEDVIDFLELSKEHGLPLPTIISAIITGRIANRRPYQARQ